MDSILDHSPLPKRRRTVEGTRPGSLQLKVGCATRCTPGFVRLPMTYARTEEKRPSAKPARQQPAPRDHDHSSRVCKMNFAHPTVYRLSGQRDFLPTATLKVGIESLKCFTESRWSTADMTKKHSDSACAVACDNGTTSPPAVTTGISHSKPITIRQIYEEGPCISFSVCIGIANVGV